MNPTNTDDRLSGLFRWVIRKRWWVIAFYALLLAPAIWFALKVEQDNSIDRLIVDSDPDNVASKAFEKVFGTGEYVVILAEADDPYRPEVLKTVDDLEARLNTIPHVSANSALSIFRRGKGAFTPDAAGAAAFKAFATGTKMFRRQGLVQDHFISIPLVLTVKGSKDRHDTVAAIDAALAPLEAHPAPLTSLLKIGQPYVNAYLDTDTQKAGMRLFPVFFLFVIILNYLLYRSFRTLCLFVLVLGVSAAVTVGIIGLIGGTFTIISSIVPMTILITCTATLVYMQSRFVECPQGVDVEEHRIFALRNKFLASTASIFATAVGFAALAVSPIRPIREMGIWVAIGLGFTWLAVFTLFPALQRVLRTPTMSERKVAGAWFERITLWLPRFSYRWRWLLVSGALFSSALGAVALFGFPGVISKMNLETNAVEYINHETPLYKNTKQFEAIIGGLSVTEIWIKGGKKGSVTDADVLLGLQHFCDALEEDPRVGSAFGVTSVLRTVRYLNNQGDQLPDTVAGMEAISAQLETALNKEPMLARFVERKELAQTHIAVVTQTVDWERFESINKMINERWAAAVKRDPALAQFNIKAVGLAPLQAKISHHLVPTLVESFALTVGVIFLTFLLVFRSGAARVMAMIPSLFAILVMFGLMRLFGMTLNVATILIASTVLGTSENDQVHFFYHYQERAKDGAEAGLRYTLGVAGKAIFFATLINAGGFLAFALADLPPMRQFGILSALAFVLSMLADFTALPAALWLVFRERPDDKKPADHAGKAPDDPGPPVAAEAPAAENSAAK